MRVTEPNALYRLLEVGGVKIFDNPSNKSFHPKTYIFKKENAKVYVLVKAVCLSLHLSEKL